MSADPGPASAAPPTQLTCDARPNDNVKKLLECVTLGGVREHQAAFQQHLQTLRGDLQNLIDATRTGDVPEGLVSTLTDDSFVVGKDCGLSGWTG